MGNTQKDTLATYMQLCMSGSYSAAESLAHNAQIICKRAVLTNPQTYADIAAVSFTSGNGAAQTRGAL